MEKIYENIRRFRTMKGLSQQNLATELNISQRHYGRIENGEVDINYSLLCKISKVLNIKLQYLIGIEDLLNFSLDKKNDQLIANNTIEYENITKLYERLIKEKDEHVNSLKSLLHTKK